MHEGQSPLYGANWWPAEAGSSRSAVENPQNLQRTKAKIFTNKLKSGLDYETY